MSPEFLKAVKKHIRRRYKRFQQALKKAQVSYEFPAEGQANSLKRCGRKKVFNPDKPVYASTKESIYRNQRKPNVNKSTK